MRIVIWGAGAIGGTLGAYLLRAGHDILFVDIVEEHVAKINQSGLQISGPVEEFTVQARAVLPHQLQEQYPIILLCSKAQNTKAATETLVDFLAGDGYVMSVQNGLNELIIREIVGGERTLGAFINFSADYHEPGKILFGGRGAVVVGELDGAITARLEEIGAAFRDFDKNTVITDDLWGYLWGKEAYGAMLFVSALTNESIAEALAAPGYRALYIRAAQEILEVAARIGVTARGFNGFEPAAFAANDPDGIEESLDALVAFNRASAKTHSGIWRDLAVRKRKTEAVMYEPILSEGERLGLDLPLTRGWMEMIHQIEDGSRPQAIANLDELKAEFL